MGSAMETFCCSNKSESNNQQNQYDSSTNPSLILPENKNLPSNTILIGSDISKILQINRNDNNGNFFSNYELLEKIGQGECSEVFLIKNKNDKNIYVLKKMKRNKSINLNDEEATKQIESLKQLNHSYINKIYDYYISDDYIFIIEEFCSEGSLKDKLDKIQIFPEFIVKIIMFQMFKCLIYLNSKNITHGNIKLENILLELNDIKKEKKIKKNSNFENDLLFKAINNDITIINNSLGNKNANYKIDLKQKDSIKIFNKKINESQKRVESSQVSTHLRFGSLKNVDEKLKAIPNLKYTGSNNIYNSGKLEFLNFGIKINDFNCSQILNRNKSNQYNLLYCSPEAISNNENNDYSDIWDCGIIMFYLLSGIFPFSGQNEEEIKRKISLGKFIFDFDLFNGVSEDAKDLIKKCLKIDNHRRISVIEAMNHPFFDDLKDSKVYLEDEKKILENLKNQKEHPIFYQMVLTFISYNFNDKPLLHELSRIFYKIDRNTDGKITKEDLLNAYEEAGEKISKKELEEIINMVDFDKNGFIEYEEFIRVCIPEDRLFTNSNLKNAFDLFDTEKKGSITYMQVVEALEREDKINGKMIELLKKEVTKMGNELLDYEKFKNLMENLSLK
jgi:serine/threonine protein kinase